MNVAVTSAPHLAAHPCVAASGRALTHLEVRSLPSSAAPSAGLAMRDATGFEWVAVTSAPHLAAHPCVAASGRALTHLEVRSLPSSAAPSAGLASVVARSR